MADKPSVDQPSFADHLYGLGLNSRTVSYYLRDVARAERWLERRGASLATAPARLIAEYAATLPFSHSTRGRVAAAVQHFWEWSERPYAPRRAFRVPPAPEMVCKALEDHQAHALAKISLGWWPQGTAVLFGLYLGLRRFEIAKAEWGRFDRDLSWYRVTGKRDKTRTLPVNPVLAGELTEHRGEGFVFPGRFGGSVNPATIWSWVEKVGDAAGIPGLIPHVLRHTCLAVALDQTRDLRGVQDFARHAKPSTTSGYTRTKARRLREISDSLNYL